MPTTETPVKWWLTLRFAVEYAIARLALVMVDLVPLRAAVWLAARTGDVMFYAAFNRRRIAIANILHSGITREPAEAARIARESFRNFAIMLVETARSDVILRDERWREHMTYTIDPAFDSVVKAPGQGLILAGGHYGNFELGGQFLSLFKPTAGVMRALSNPFVDRMIKRRFPRVQFHFVAKNDPDMTRFVRLLDAGEILGLMIDQHGGTRGMVVDFLGQPASTHTAVALLHLITEKPICFGYCRRLGLMRYEIGGAGPFVFERTGDRQRDTRAILDILNAELEKIIRRDPTQYMWGHRRWRPEDVTRAIR
jgi:KDO2-lipid IV(A) lauroyltransferase